MCVDVRSGECEEWCVCVDVRSVRSGECVRSGVCV